MTKRSVRQADDEGQETANDGGERAGGASVNHERGPSLEMPKPTSMRYPDYDMPFIGSKEELDERFAEVVEAFLVNYGYNTARAYRNDLEDVFMWARERGLDFFELTAADLKRYTAFMRRRGYSEGTIRRRQTSRNSLIAQQSREGGRFADGHRKTWGTPADVREDQA